MRKPTDLSRLRVARSREALALRMRGVLDMVADLVEELSLLREQLRTLEHSERTGAPLGVRRVRTGEDGDGRSRDQLEDGPAK